MRRMLTGLAAVGLTVSTLAACESGGEEAESPSSASTSAPPAQASPGSSTPAPATFNGGTTQVSTPETMPAYLTDINVGVHPGFDRVVFEFSNLLPGYRIGLVNGPFTEDGSGNPITIQGPGHIEAHFSAAGYDSGGNGQQTYNGPLRIQAPSGASVLTELARTGDYEAHLTWIIGTNVPAQFLVQTLTNPIRVVIDIAPQ